MNISYEGIGHLAVTMPAGECAVGQVCAMGDDGKAAAGAVGGKFCGVVEAVENGMAAVQVAGFVTLGYTDTAPTTGYTTLACDGNGTVAVNSAGNSYLVVAVDTANNLVTFKL